MAAVVCMWMKGKDMAGAKRWLVALAAVVCLLAPAVARAGAAETAGELLESARQSFDRKDYERAVTLASRVARRHADGAEAEEAMLVWSDALFEQNKYVSAYEVCEKLLDAYPRSTHRTAVLRRELKIGEALTRAELDLYVTRISRITEGVKMMNRVVERAPFGPLADDAVLAIADAHLRAASYEEARDQYDRLLKNYPNSTLTLRARVSRALCSYRMSSDAAYDTAPAEEAKRELEVLSRVSGDEELARRMTEMRDLLAHGDYSTGLFYVQRGNFRGAQRYMGAVIAKYPKSEFAARAKRILASLEAAQAEE